MWDIRAFLEVFFNLNSATVSPLLLVECIRRFLLEIFEVFVIQYSKIALCIPAYVNDFGYDYARNYDSTFVRF